MDQAQAEKKLARAYATGGGKKLFPWAVIFEQLVKRLQGCSTPNAKRFARKHPVALQFMLRGEIKEIVGTSESNAVAGAAVSVFNSTSVSDVDEMRSVMGI